MYIVAWIIINYFSFLCGNIKMRVVQSQLSRWTLSEPNRILTRRIARSSWARASRTGSDPETPGYAATRRADVKAGQDECEIVCWSTRVGHPDGSGNPRRVSARRRLRRWRRRTAWRTSHGDDGGGVAASARDRGGVVGVIGGRGARRVRRARVVVARRSPRHSIGPCAPTRARRQPKATKQKNHEPNEKHAIKPREIENKY